MKGHWLFDIGSTYYYSTQAVTLLSHNYLARIIPDSFSGISMRGDVSSRLFQPNECEFSISNADQTLDAADFEGEDVTITLTDTGYAGFYRQWLFTIQTAVESYGAIKCICTDKVTDILSGEYPKTMAIKAAFPDGNANVDDSWCVPRTIGKAFIPIVPVLKNGQRYYVLGESAVDDFTIDRVLSPREWDYHSEWTSDRYTFNQENIFGNYNTSSACKVARFIIADSDEDGEPDANGVWIPGGYDSILNPLVEYTGETAACGPGTFIQTVLEDCGITNCNDASFAAVDSALSSIEWNYGWFKFESLEGLIADMLACCDCYLWADDEIHLAQFSATKIESIDKTQIIKDSFSASRISKSTNNGGVVKWFWAGDPQDEMTGYGVAPLTVNGFNSGTTPTDPSTEAFEYRFETFGDYDWSNTVNAMHFGCLYLQKKLAQSVSISFKTMVDSLTTGATIRPGQVIRIDDNASGEYSAYGASMDVVITSIQFDYDLSVSIEGFVCTGLADYNTATNAYAVYKPVPSGVDFNMADHDVKLSSDGEAAKTCILQAVSDEFPDDNNIVQISHFVTKSDAKTYATNLWRDFGDDAKLEPWASTITGVNTWTGDTTDFSISSGALIGEFATSDSKSLTLDLSSTPISAEDIRLSATGTIVGTSSSTYLRIKITDDSANVAYLYILNGDSEFSPGAGEYDIGSGETITDLADCGITDKITEIKIECAVHSGDTSLDISMPYLDVERHLDLDGVCASCEGGSVGAYVVRNLEDEAYTPYVVSYNECETTTTSESIPAFHVASCGFTEISEENPILIPDIKRFDFGNNFDEETGIFTAPFAGLYSFSACVGMDSFAPSGENPVGSVWFTIDTDNDCIEAAHVQFADNNGPTDDFASGCASGLLYLEKDDTVWVSVGVNNGTANVYYNFSGFFVSSVKTDSSFAIGVCQAE